MNAADFPDRMNTHSLGRAGSAPRLPLLSVLVSVACAAMACGAQAQEAATPPSAAASAPAQAVDKLDIVTVSATRRREPAREVPVQVQAIAAEKLEKAGARQLVDYMADQPGVNVNTAGAGFNSITMRGVSTGAQTIATVGMYIDDVAFGSSGAYSSGAQTALDMSLLDLHHIEVLRGPQGTLYGAGAMGGLLKYVTNDPDSFELSGKVGLGASTTKGGGTGHTENAVVNVPLKEGVAGLRVAAFNDHAGGYIDAIGALPGKNINRGDTRGARVSLLVEPSTKLKLRVTALSQEIKHEGHDYAEYSGTTGRPLAGDYEKYNSLREPLVTKVQLVSAGAEAELGWARFESITSAQSSSLGNDLDYTSVYAPLLKQLAGLTVDTVAVRGHYKTRKETQEFRLTSPSSSSFEWLAGIFYTHERGTNNQLSTSTLPGGGEGPLLLSASLPSTLTELAAYGDVTWKPAAGLSITGGIRVARNKQEFGQNTSGALAGGPQSLSGSSEETSKTYLATVSYALDRVSNVYIRAASGYRPGGPNALVVDPSTHLPIAPPVFKHDSLWSYEAGYKADLLSKTLNIEASVYDIRWTDIQQFTSVNGMGVITNGGKAKVQGVELGLRYKPSEQVSFNAGLSYLDAKLTEGADGLGAAGAQLPNSARLSASLGSTYKFTLADRAAWIGGSARYQGKRNAGFDGSNLQPNFRLPAYWLADLQAGIEFQRFQVSAYVRNVLNHNALLAASTLFVPLGGPVEATVAQPRTVGVTLSASF